MRAKTIATLFSLFNLFAFITHAANNEISTLSNHNNTVDEIKLTKQNGSTRSASLYELTVYSDNETYVEIVVSNYNGDVSISFEGGRSSINQNMYVNGVGTDYIDFNRLRGGVYTITIVIDGDIYEGLIVKEVTGGR